ncbi:type VII toxin-antitoxin system MntA family adenylyltransferase antitoxin [Gracilinema caldarium]|uniref:DNA polymerase beta domain protein region n=1 Tax=Gracilinema caldarium (strain ATCC 51460 / DSM 7334 / H1) TaxID=744872 RepID=F8F389_GRAC1|nr:nucleotidyltransferase domain-containing protein [Gracilinema caldarium]AEJ20415.1 DNA polymerase beta domain protein region [Gracilinema caldarium DSM 7334]
MKLSQKVIDQIRFLLEQDVRIAAAYLLGSSIQGRMRPDSDIDVAVLPFQGIALHSLDLAAIGGHISYEVGRQVDVGLLSSANLVYARQVLGAGYRLFTKDPFYVDLMETSLISMYLWFTEERKELVHAYQR